MLPNVKQPFAVHRGAHAGTFRLPLVHKMFPGLGTVYKALTRVVPLGRGRVVERDGILYVS